MTKPVILAPAGTPDSLKAAISNGANAVYLGVEAFNARMKAGNFTTETLSEWVSYAHLFGVKVYVTLNILIKEKEFERACETARRIYQANADGLIVTDLGLARFCATYLSGIELYASTQLSTSNRQGAIAARELGFTGVVAARECRNEDIADLAEVTDTEVFIQGAMCVCVSGQCYMSSMADGNSGNRGLCAQPCRKLYSAYYGDKLIKKGYLLSMKDLCSVETMHDAVKAGARTFKIEGRNRRPEYVAQASKTYRDLVASGYKVDEENLLNLKKMFNRGDFSKGYAYEENKPSLMSTVVQGHKGVSVGRITAVNARGEQISVKLSQPFEKGDGFKLYGKDGTEIGSAVALNSSKGLKTGILFYKGNPTVGDTVAITTDTALLKLISLTPLLQTEMRFVARKGEKAELYMTCGGKTVTVYSEEEIASSENQPADEAVVSSQLLRLGDTDFTCRNLKIDIDEGVFIPKSVLNAMRRTAVGLLKRELLSDYDKRAEERSVNIGEFCHKAEQSLDGYEKDGKRMLYFSEIAQLDGVYNQETDILVYKPMDFSFSSESDEVFKSFEGRVYADIPNMLRKKDVECVKRWIEHYKPIGIAVNNIGAIGLAKELDVAFLGGLGLNIANRATVRYLKGIGMKYFLYSQELNQDDIADIEEGGFEFAYGTINNMTLTHCPYKNIFGYDDCSRCKCTDSSKKLYYVDELNNRFEIRRRRVSECYFNVINAVSLNFGDERNIKRNYCIDLTGGAWRFKYTRGRLFKGVK